MAAFGWVRLVPSYLFPNIEFRYPVPEVLGVDLQFLLALGEGKGKLETLRLNLNPVASTGQAHLPVRLPSHHQLPQGLPAALQGGLAGRVIPPSHLQGPGLRLQVQQDLDGFGGSSWDCIPGRLGGSVQNTVLSQHAAGVCGVCQSGGWPCAGDGPAWLPQHVVAVPGCRRLASRCTWGVEPKPACIRDL